VTEPYLRGVGAPVRAEELADAAVHRVEELAEEEVDDAGRLPQVPRLG
jgi:hypothetical protein